MILPWLLLLTDFHIFPLRMSIKLTEVLFFRFSVNILVMLSPRLFPSDTFLAALRHIVDDSSSPDDSLDDKLTFYMAVSHLYLISGLSHLVPDTYKSAYDTLQQLIASLEPGRALKK